MRVFDFFSIAVELFHPRIVETHVSVLSDEYQSSMRHHCLDELGKLSYELLGTRFLSLNTILFFLSDVF